MASRMMHYVIARRICKEINIKNINAFCLGAVVVDCYKASSGVPKGISHFLVDYGDCRVFDFKNFSNKYLKEDVDEFCLGYFLHLLMDSIYLKDIVGNTIYQYDLENREDVKHKFDSDMHIYNAILRNRYNFNYDLIPLNQWKVEEINVDDQYLFLKEFEKDFKDKRIGKFEVISHKMIENYMEKSFEIGLRNIKYILNNQDCDDPIQFALSNDLR